MCQIIGHTLSCSRFYLTGALCRLRHGGQLTGGVLVNQRETVRNPQVQLHQNVPHNPPVPANHKNTQQVQVGILVRVSLTGSRKHESCHFSKETDERHSGGKTIQRVWSSLLFQISSATSASFQLRMKTRERLDSLVEFEFVVEVLCDGSQQVPPLTTGAQQERDARVHDGVNLVPRQQGRLVRHVINKNLDKRKRFD